MQVKSLVALLPLLLGTASSVAIPAAPDACGAVEAHLRRNTDLQDVPKEILSHCLQRRGLEEHLELVTGDGQQLKPSQNSGDHIISPRKPPKQDPNQGGKTPAGGTPPGQKARKKPAGQNQAAKQGTGLPDRTRPRPNPAGNSNQQPQNPAGGSGSDSAPGSADQKKKEEEEKKRKEDEERKKNGGNNSPSEDESSSDSESDEEGDVSGDSGSESEEEDNDSTGTYRPPSQSSSDSGDEKAKQEEEKAKKQKAKEEKKAEREKQKQIDKERAPSTMYHVVTPDPNKGEGIKDKDTGRQSYNRKVGDGVPGRRYKTHNPDHSIVESGNQIPGREKTDTDPGRLRPGRIEEKETTGHRSGKGLTEWHKITPKTQEELDKNPDTKGKKPWTDDDLSKNLKEQQKEFPCHKSGDKTDAFGKLTKEMMDYCNAEQRKTQYRRALARRALAGEPLLRRSLDNWLQRRDDMTASNVVESERAGGLARHRRPYAVTWRA